MLNNVIIKPVVTEKSVAEQRESNRYTFRVNKKASKGAIANAVEDLFKVEVSEVRTKIMPGKKRRIRGKQQFTKTASWKKAVVGVKDGKKIDLFTDLIGGSDGN